MNEHLPTPETELDDELIYDGHIVHLHVKTVKLPSGHYAKREVIRHAGAVAVVPLLPDGRVMLIRQYRHAVGKTLLEIPAGTLEPNEDPNLAAIRELREEIGHSAKQLVHIGGIYVAPGYSTEFIHIYIATDLVHDPLQADADEIIEIEPMLLSDALEAIQRGDIQDAKSIVGLLWAGQRFR